MNYQKHYQTLIDRAKQRNINSYTESHHIIPKCIGGADISSNLIRLTGREHLIAHLLLVKIYPNNHGLVKAANMMCVSSSNHTGRSKNRTYSRLREKLSKSMSNSQKGKKNSQYGKKWIFSIELNISKKVFIDELDFWINSGWQIGRVIDFSSLSTCPVCEMKYKPISGSGVLKWCSAECRNNTPVEIHPLDIRKEEFLNFYNKNGNMDKSLKCMGLLGASGGYYYWAKRILNESN
ncbi:MAG: HNH endonuclease [Candidatus Peribacteraceae bacterium]|nr:HNH endonuclease [Candidatus Peribacteraceae bacterium]